MRMTINPSSSPMKNRFGILPGVVLVVSLFVVVSQTSEAALASDDASQSAYSDGWTAGDNGGTGFGEWSFTYGGGGPKGALIGNSSANGDGSSGNINTTGNKSFGLYADPYNEIHATRSFTYGTLAAGQEFLVNLDNGYINNGASVGFILQKSDGTALFKYSFVGGQSFYQYDVPSGTGGGNTSVGFTADGLSVAFALGSGNAFSVKVNGNVEGSGTLAAGDISKVEFFNIGTGPGPNYNFFFNSLQVVPEPTTIALSIFGALALAGLVIRRVHSRSSFKLQPSSVTPAL